VSTTALRVLLVAPQPFYQDRGTPITVLQVLHALCEIGYRLNVLTCPLSDEVRASSLAVAARSHSEANFGWSRFVESVGELYGAAVRHG
jgi:hypothetical protein